MSLTGLRLAGVDLAWQSERNPSAIALGRLSGGTLCVSAVHPAVYGMRQMHEILASDAPDGIAIDAPLIIPNTTGQRDCERALGRIYASRKAACHPANTTLYPRAGSVALAGLLRAEGFCHASGPKWQIECYPHAALIEIFGLPERLPYKKGTVVQKRAGQVRLANLLKTLRHSAVLPLDGAVAAARILDCGHIESLRGRALKNNEDALDALICLYIAGLYAIGAGGRLFGDVETGYIWVPGRKCA